MASEIIGTVTCPHCGNAEATVHRQAKGKHSLYYRCYAAPGSVEMRCGTVQIHGPKGQAWIKANMHGQHAEAANDPKAPEPAPKPMPEAANDPKAPEPTPKRSSVFGAFLSNLSRDEE